MFSDYTYLLGYRITYRTRHFINFGIMVIFSSLMMAIDIGSDIVTGIDYLNSRDSGWAAFTFVIICTPWMSRILISLANLRICFINTLATPTEASAIRFSHEGWYLWKLDMLDSFLEFPLFQPIRYELLWTLNDMELKLNWLFDV